MPARPGANEMSAAGDDDAIDIAFELQGKYLGKDYSFALMREIVRRLPWIESELEAGIHPLRSATNDAGALLLPRRAKLVLRLPRRRVRESMALCGHGLTVGGHELKVGTAKLRRLLPIGTLYARMVTAANDDEQAFMKDVASSLRALQASCEPVCGKRRTVRTETQEIVGYGLLLHGLGPEQSVRMQRVGLGDNRMLGCGVFVGHKSAAAVA